MASKILPWVFMIGTGLEALVNFGCKGPTPVTPDSPPYFVSGEPTAEVTTTKIGNSHTVKGTAEDPDGDDIDYETLKDGVKVNDNNEDTFTIDKKGMTKIQIVAYNALSDTLTKYFSAENQAPIATSPSISMPEEGTRTLTDLDSDPDGDSLTRSITATSNVNANFNNNGELEITGIDDYFGPASVSYSSSDGEETSNGTVSINFTNTQDNPNANAGADLSKTIDKEIGLDGSQSNHPDNPLSTITDYEWTQISGPDVNIQNNNLANANFTAETEGEYEFQLKVKDSEGYEQTDSVKISIDSYKVIVNATNVLTDAGISGLEVMLAGKTVVTDANGRAELEYPTNVSTSGNLKIQDENIEGSIGYFFNYNDTESTNITGDLEFNIEMIPNVEWDNTFYDNVIDFLKQMRGGNITTTPGELLEDYPILIDINESEMPAAHYLTGITDAIEHINNKLGAKLGVNIYEITTNNDARYIFDYSDNNSKFDLEYIQKDGVWYIGTATVYIKNNITSGEPVKETTIHETGIPGVGLREHSLDKKDIGFAPTWWNETSGYSQNEKKALEIYLKLHSGTDLNKTEKD